jgi:hypothetical protein
MVLDVLPVKEESPAYVQTMECEPNARLPTFSAPVPPESVVVPIFVLPSLQLTLPVGVAEEPPPEETAIEIGYVCP